MNTTGNNLIFRCMATVLLFAFANAALAGGLCGNSRLDRNETCDDGNNQIGDGCSAQCQIEDNFECSAPYQSLSNNAVADGHFEFGSPSNVWDEFSSVGAPVLCNLDTCPNELGPRQGGGWARFGNRVRSSFDGLRQEILIDPAQRFLQFDIMQDVCDSGEDRFQILIDNSVVFVADGDDPRCGGSSYDSVLVDLATAAGGPFNDGNVHQLILESTTAFELNGPTVFSLDNLIVGKPLTPSVPSFCGLRNFIASYDDFDPGVAGDLGSLGYTQFELGENPFPWGTTDDGVCGTSEIPPGNFTGGDGDAACIDATAGGGGMILSYMCSDAIDFVGRFGPSLSFQLNFQVNGGSPDDFFAVVGGLMPPTGPGVVLDYEPLLVIQEPVGQFGQPPGQLINLSLPSDFANQEAYLCFVFSSNGEALYAQVDNVNASYAGCLDGVDKDKLEQCNDNCTEVFNPDQTDSDGDGYGNACDGDIGRFSGVRVASGNGNDCIVNALDLGMFRQAFFATPGDSNWNPDADFNNDLQINVEDLGLMRTFFFKPPGPSGVTNTCSP